MIDNRKKKKYGCNLCEKWFSKVGSFFHIFSFKCFYDTLKLPSQTSGGKN